MLSSDKNIETISQLIYEIKHYIDLQKQCFQLDFVEKLTRLLTALVVGAICFLLTACIVLFLSMLFVSAITPYVGHTTAYLIVVLIYLTLALLVCYNRKRWIATPIAHFLSQLFLPSATQSPTDNNQNDKA